MERLAAPGRRSRREAHGPGGIDRQHGARHRREREPRRKPGPDAPDFKVDDRRVARSKRLIRGAFQELLAEKGYEAVTASMVIERADVGRATFYARFSSKEALMADLLDQICAHVIAPVEPEPEHDFTRSETPEALVEHALRHLLAGKWREGARPWGRQRRACGCAAQVSGSKCGPVPAGSETGRRVWP